MNTWFKRRTPKIQSEVLYAQQLWQGPNLEHRLVRILIVRWMVKALLHCLLSKFLQEEVKRTPEAHGCSLLLLLCCCGNIYRNNLQSQLCWNLPVTQHQKARGRKMTTWSKSVRATQQKPFLNESSDWEAVFANSVLDKGLIARINEELLKLNIQPPPTIQSEVGSWTKQTVLKKS